MSLIKHILDEGSVFLISYEMYLSQTLKTLHLELLKNCDNKFWNEY